MPSVTEVPDRTVTIAPPRLCRISPEQAAAAYAILVEHVGAHPSEDERHSFVFAITDQRSPCEEYRFCGSLGFGGKFRNNGNNGAVPYVDCYREHETPARLAAIKTVNQRLRDLFGEVTRG